MDTLADLERKWLLSVIDTAAPGTDTDGLTIADLYDIVFGGDVTSLGLNSAIIKNWGLASESVNEAKRRKFEALSSETLNDAAYRWFNSQLSGV